VLLEDDYDKDNDVRHSYLKFPKPNDEGVKRFVASNKDGLITAKFDADFQRELSKVHCNESNPFSHKVVRRVGILSKETKEYFRKRLKCYGFSDHHIKTNTNFLFNQDDKYKRYFLNNARNKILIPIWDDRKYYTLRGSNY